MTSLGDELFVFYGNTDVITIIDTESYNVKRTIQIPGLGAVHDMTSSERLRCVYVADRSKNVIHRVSDDDSLTQWPVNDKPESLSVNAADNVLVTCQSVMKIKEFTTDGKLIRIMKLQNDFTNPWHAIQLTNDRLLISHGSGTDSLNRVCVVNSTGDVVHSFGGSDNDQLDVPLRMVVSGVILVADFNNRRIVMLSPTLSFIRTVVSCENFPILMSFHERTKKLFVATRNLENGGLTGGKLKVFSVL
jgi:hypothetical protein